MRWLRICALVGAFAPVSCSPTSPSDLPAAYAETIKQEWTISQELLRSVGVGNTGLVLPRVCTWIPHDGPFETSASFTGWANGEFDPNTFTIKWNTRTPAVLRHEAGHAILHFLDHPCASCWSVDGNIGEPNAVTLHRGCEGAKIGRYCEALLKHDRALIIVGIRNEHTPLFEVA